MAAEVHSAPQVSTVQQRRPNRIEALVAAAASVIAMSYAVTVPAGLPYDEPAHWANVRFWSQHWRMPVLGDPGTSYEAQMGPVTYLLHALLGVATGTSGHGATALLVARASGVIVLAWLFAVVHLAVHRGLGCDHRVAALASGVAVLNPMVIAVGMSVQNDTLALALAVTGMLVVLGHLWRSGGPLAVSVTAGVLVGLAVLTKITVLPVLPAAMYALWRRQRGRAGLPLLWHVATVSALCGWWFVRNEVLYGDLSGRAGVERAGFHFGALAFEGPATVTHLAGQVITYLWLPTEYFRNSINAPNWLAIALVVLTAVVMIAGCPVWRAGWECRLWGALGAGCCLLWLVTVLTVQAVAFRTAYLCLVGWAFLVAAALSRLPSRGRAGGCLIVLLVLHLWTLHAVAATSFPPGVGP